MWKEITFKTERTFISKLCLLKRVVFFKKEHFRTFENWIILIEMKDIFYLEQNIFFENLSKIWDWSRPIFETVCTKMGYNG